MASGKHLIILVHGIRDPGFWETTLSDLLGQKENDENVADVHVEAIKTEVVDLFRFIAPTTVFRKKFIDDVETSITSCVFDDKFKDYKKTIIAHSFGTYIVSEILHRNTNIKIDQLIMCGGIVNNDFRWDRVRKINFTENSDTNPTILNEYSPKDIWPVLAKVFAFGYGNIGSKGVGKAGVRDRKHYIPHHGYLNKGFVEEYWVPFIFESKIAPSPKGPNKFKTPWFFIFTKIPINWMSVAIGIISAWIAAISVYKVSYSGNLVTRIEFEAPATESAINLLNLSLSGTHIVNSKHVNRIVYFHDPKKEEGTARRYYITTTSDGPITKFNIVITSRPPYVCEDEEGYFPPVSGPISPNATSNRKLEISRYTIKFKHSSTFSNMLDRNFSGSAEFLFNYIPVKNIDADLIGDFLEIIPGRGVKSNSTKAKLNLHSHNCTPDATQQNSMYYVADAADEIRDHSTTGKLNIFNLVSTAFARDFKNLKSIDEKSIAKHLVSPDSKARSLATQELTLNPSKYDGLVREVLTNLDSLGDDQLADYLDALTTVYAQNKSIVKIENFIDIFKLTWSESRSARKSARKFLRAEEIASLNLANNLKKFWTEKGSKFSPNVKIDGRYRREYLAHLAIRDIYYNAGIYRFQNSREIGTGMEPIDNAVKASLKIFDAAQWIIDESPLDEKPSMAKPLYAKAHVMFRYARIKDATNNRYNQESAKEIKFEVQKSLQNGKFLKKANVESKMVLKFFNDFLDNANQDGSYYPWKQHIKQAKNCTTGSTRLSYSCLDRT